MKTALIFLLGGAIVFLAVKSPETVESRDTVQTTQNANSQKEEADGKRESDRSPKDQEFDALAKEVFNPDGSLKKLPKGVKHWTFYGSIRQHLGDGLLLVHCGTRGANAIPSADYAVVALSDLTDLPDGSQVKFLGIRAGTYQYTTIAGALRTIPQLLCIPPEALPTPAPGEWMWEGKKISLDPPRRR